MAEIAPELNSLHSLLIDVKQAFIDQHREVQHRLEKVEFNQNRVQSPMQQPPTIDHPVMLPKQIAPQNMVFQFGAPQPQFSGYVQTQPQQQYSFILPQHYIQQTVPMQLPVQMTNIVRVEPHRGQEQRQILPEPVEKDVRPRRVFSPSNFALINNRAYSPQTGFAPIPSDIDLLPNPILDPKFIIDPKQEQPGAVQAEFIRLFTKLDHEKNHKIRQLINSIPPPPKYNERKARAHKKYDDPVLKAKHEKNNASSRQSRNKKKYETKVQSVRYEVNTEENSELHDQEQWLILVINQLEKYAMRSGLNTEGLMELRAKCGLR